MTRVVKQAAYGAFFLAIIIGMFAWFYFSFLRAPAGCDNGRKDAGEEGIDCGGVCARVCIPPDFQDLQVDGAVNVFRPSPRVATVLARVRNPNLGLAAQKFSYTVTLQAADGSSRGTARGASFIHAGEVKYIAAVVDVADAQAVRTATLAIEDPAWVAPRAMTKPAALSIQNLTTEEDKVLLRVRVAGKIMNRDTTEVERVEVVAVFQDASGVPVGATRSFIDRIGANASRDFSVLYPPSPNIFLSRTQVLVSASAVR